MVSEPKKTISCAEAGKRGGQKTSETHGQEFYEEIGRKGGQKIAETRGKDYFRDIGKKGGLNRGKKGQVQ